MPMGKQGIWPENWGLLYAAFAFSQGIGLITYWALPILAGALMAGLGLTVTEVGLLGTIEFAGLFVASLVVAPLMDRGYRKRIAVIAVAVVVLTNALCAVLEVGFAELAALRFVAGLGAGLALAVGNATIANAEDTERFSGHLTILLVAFMVVIMPIYSRVSEAYGHKGVFAALAVTVLIGALSMLFLPNEPNADLTDQTADDDGGAVLLSLAGISILAVALLFGARDTLPWLVAEQLGADAGMTLPQIGDLFSLMYAVSILGPAILLVVSRWFGAKTLLALTMGLTGLFAWLFTVSAGDYWQFAIGIVVWATIYFMAFALLNAVAALVDRSGRLVSAVGSSFIAGVTIAPFFGGYLVDQGGYTWLGAAELVLTAVVVVLIVLTLRGRHLRPAAA